METFALAVRRGHVIAILIANAVLWAAVILVTGNTLVGGAGAVALISIASLMTTKNRVA